MSSTPTPPPPRTGRERRAAIGPTVLATFIVALSGFMAWRALSFPLRPRLAPLAFATITFVLALGVLAAEIVDYIRVRRSSGPMSEEGDEVTTLGTADARTSREELVAFGWLAVLVAAFFLFGFIVGMTAFMLAMMRVYGKEKWTLNLAVTTGVMTFMYVLFVRILGVRVYAGMLGDVLPFLPG